MSNHNNPNRKKYMFYWSESKYQIQRGLYMLFVERRKIPVEKLLEYVESYATHHIFKKKAEKLDWIDMNFDNFIEHVSTQSGIKFSKRKYSRASKEDRVFEEWNNTVISGEIGYDDF